MLTIHYILDSIRCTINPLENPTDILCLVNLAFIIKVY